MYCPKCGKEITSEDTKFCPACGKSLASDLKKSDAPNTSGVNLRLAMLLICGISAISAVFLWLYGHNVFGRGDSYSCSPEWWFYNDGGINVFFAVIAVTVISGIMGMCCKKK